MKVRSNLPTTWLWWPRSVWLFIGVETLLLLYLFVSRMAIGPEMGLPMFDHMRDLLRSGGAGETIMATVFWTNLAVTIALWAAWRSARSTSEGGAATLLVVLAPAVVLLSLSLLGRQLARSVAPFPVEAVIERTAAGTYVVSPSDPVLESMLADP